MGINPHSLSKAARVAGGITLVNGKARPQLAMPVPGWCWWFLDMEPPTVTHGDKDIGWRRSRRTGANVPTIVKNPKLKAVWDLYCRHIQDRPTLIPLSAPVAHELEIVRLCQNGTRRAAEIGTPGGKRRPDRPRPRIEAAAGRIQGSAAPSSATNGVTGVDSPAPQKGGKRKRS